MPPARTTKSACPGASGRTSYRGLKPAPTAIAIRANNPSEYKILRRRMSPSPSFATPVTIASACTGRRLRAGAWRGRRWCGAGGAGPPTSSCASDHLLRSSGSRVCGTGSRPDIARRSGVRVVRSGGQGSAGRLPRTSRSHRPNGLDTAIRTNPTIGRRSGTGGMDEPARNATKPPGRPAELGWSGGFALEAGAISCWA
jgi:hypothetical protein